MAFELDHLFICTDVNAGAAERLISNGLREGSANQHPGQGTANRRFFFHNAMLELLWVDDPQAARSAPVRRSRLWERWSNRQRVCPFGICLRLAANSGVTNFEETAAFSSWDYQPPYLPETVSIAVGTNSDLLTEPMLFQIPFGCRPDQSPPEKAQPLEHPLGLREITRVELVSPVAYALPDAQPTQPSLELQAVLDSNHIKLRAGDAYSVELGFDGEGQGQQLDFRPELPLVVSW